MGNRVLDEVLDYWNRLRGGRAAPMRSEIDPRRIENALEYAFILERAAPGNTRFRLAGMHLGDLMGMEVRAMAPDAFILPDERTTFATLLDDVFARPAIARLDLVSAGTGRMPLKARMLLLPMRSDTGEMTRALGCLIADGVIGTAPRRFSIISKTVTALTGAPTWDAISGNTAPGFAEPARPFAPASPLAPPSPFSPPAHLRTCGHRKGHPDTSNTRRSGARPHLHLVTNDEA